MAEWTKDRSLSNLAKGLDPAKGADTGYPVTDMIRWSSAANTWQIYNGAAWVALTATYAIDISSTNGLIARTAANTYTGRTLTAPVAGITITNPAGAAGNPTLVLANDLLALEGLGSTGIAVRSAADTWVQRALTQPAAGLTITNSDGVAGNPTFALANDLNALEGLGSTGIAVRSAADTWVQRTITGTGNEITVTNGDGVSANPTVSLPSALTFTGKTVTGGTYSLPTFTNPTNTHQTLTDAANIDWNMSSGAAAQVTLTANRNFNAPTNLRQGATYILRVIQDGTGGWTAPTWNAVFKWPLGITPTLVGTASRSDLFSFYCPDGTNLLGSHLKDYNV